MPHIKRGSRRTFFVGNGEDIKACRGKAKESKTANERGIGKEAFLYKDAIADEKDECLEIPKEGYLTITSHLLDDVAMVLGLRDQVIKGTEEDADGGAYPDDVEKRMLDAYNYVKDNLFYIETLLHQMCMEGIKVGKYKAHDRDLIWEKEE